MSFADETSRIARHAVTPLAVIAVHQGWLPEAAQADVTELGIIVVSFLAALFLSWREDRRAHRKTPSQE
jgi:hypothetical protein